MDYNSGRGYDESGGAVVDTGGMQLKHSDSPMTSPGKLFVGGVAWETTQETFADYFNKFGELVDSVIMKDRMTGRPRGFGFVTFADSAVAEKVLEEQHVIDDRKVDLKKTVPRGDKETEIQAVLRTKKIFVGGLPPFLEQDELKKYFCVYGDILEHQIMYDHQTGRSRGFGFVTFQTEDSVDRLFSDGKVHELGDKQANLFYFSFADYFRKFGELVDSVIMKDRMTATDCYVLHGRNQVRERFKLSPKTKSLWEGECFVKYSILLYFVYINTLIYCIF